jgi:curli production assembly/transport component CsgG
MPLRVFLSFWTGLLALLAMSVGLTGCANYAAPFETRPAHPGLRSAAQPALEALPPPQEKVVVAVYRFRDQTGQYKAVEQGSSFSTAVTQGATAILMRALETSGWFVPIEREGLSNLLNERQIIQSIRQQHKGTDGKDLGPLPPLLYAGVMLEGGIVGYDTNVLTGGGGVRYFGIGGSGQYRQDQVTIYLRAVSTQSGRVLKTVHTTKTILSQKLDGGAFLYVDQDRILETEAGYSFNEPPVMAVTEAIDDAVRALIFEGVRDNVWAAAPDTTGQFSTALAAYDAEKAQSTRRDYFDRLLVTDARPGLGVGLRGGAQRYQGDYRSPEGRFTGALTLRYPLTPRWIAGTTLSTGHIAAEQAFDHGSVAADLDLSYLLLPHSDVTPYVQVGAGLRTRSPHALKFGTDLLPQVSARAGMEVLVGPRLGLDLSAGPSYTLHDQLDGAAQGRYDDSLWSATIGFTYYTNWFQ